MATAIKERPILFSGPMVRAILDGRKTQTRRIIKPQPKGVEPELEVLTGKWVWWRIENDKNAWDERVCPFGRVGDRLWVRETWADVNTESGPAITYAADNGLRFCSDDAFPVEYDRYPGCGFSMWCSDLWYREERKCMADHLWRPSIHMPRWASRITLEITGVKVERLQEIGEEDAVSEGVPPGVMAISASGEPYWCEPRSPTSSFSELWTELHGPESWASNPWVYAISFKRV